MPTGPTSGTADPAPFPSPAGLSNGTLLRWPKVTSGVEVLNRLMPHIKREAVQKPHVALRRISSMECEVVPQHAVGPSTCSVVRGFHVCLLEFVMRRHQAGKVKS